MTSSQTWKRIPAVIFGADPSLMRSLPSEKESPLFTQGLGQPRSGELPRAKLTHQKISLAIPIEIHD